MARSRLTHTVNLLRDFGAASIFDKADFCGGRGAIVVGAK